MAGLADRLAAGADGFTRPSQVATLVTSAMTIRTFPSRLECPVPDRIGELILRHPS